MVSITVFHGFINKSYNAGKGEASGAGRGAAKISGIPRWRRRAMKSNAMSSITCLTTEIVIYQ
jgi:hypothetical protein